MPPATQALLISNVAIYLLQASGMASLGEFALWPPGEFGSQFEPWQLVTYAFLHGSLGHLFFNMLALYMFGREIEQLFGWRYYLRYYFACVEMSTTAGLARVLVLQ